jgi:peptide deformylase
MQLVKPDAPILYRVCRPDFTITAINIMQMFHLLERCGGLGLAAPQVGIDARLFVTKWNEVFVNPILTTLGDPRPIQEGCLSFPGKLAMRLRYPAVCLADGRVFEGAQALTLQHETDHLNGIIITDPDPRRPCARREP